MTLELVVHIFVGLLLVLVHSKLDISISEVFNDNGLFLILISCTEVPLLLPFIIILLSILVSIDVNVLLFYILVGTIA